MFTFLLLCCVIVVLMHSKLTFKPRGFTFDVDLNRVVDAVKAFVNKL